MTTLRKAGGIFPVQEGDQGLCIGVCWHIHATMSMRGQGTSSQARMKLVMGTCDFGTM